MPETVTERRARRKRERALRKHRARQRAYVKRKRDAEEEAAMQLKRDLEAGWEAWRQERLEREEIQRQNLAALSQEEIEGIKRIYGFDPVQNPLSIIMLHPKQNLAIHGFYEMVHGGRQ